MHSETDSTSDSFRLVKLLPTGFIMKWRDVVVQEDVVFVE